MRRLLLLLFALVLVALGCAPADAATPRPVTVVSLTFSGTDASQSEFAELLAARDLAGTFYINSGLVGSPGHLSVAQLHTIARDRSEIGGAATNGIDLTTLTAPQVQAAVCNDRTTLAQLGFDTTSFAYPQGATNGAVQAAVTYCGYNSGRLIGGLYQSGQHCSRCPFADPLGSGGVYSIATASPPNTLAALKQQVLRAEQSGGWLPLVFTKLCLCTPDREGSVSRDVFVAFLDWLASRSGSVQVKTVDQIVGGTLQPVHGTPLPRLVPNPSAAISPPVPPSKAAAWTVLGIGIGQQQILLTGVVLALTVVVTYRLASRGSRHAH